MQPPAQQHKLTLTTAEVADLLARDPWVDKPLVTAGGDILAEEGARSLPGLVELMTSEDRLTRIRVNRVMGMIQMKWARSITKDEKSAFAMVTQLDDKLGRYNSFILDDTTTATQARWREFLLTEDGKKMLSQLRDVK